ncbi:hypothetical protein GP486_006214 [Trichoglossum hirsutum]|uniref:Stc1 domain-containing protein n=1 Tax=Trichoglossum hirsutum TaxID=265104 RepID=A0A9P8IH86_9PEZI|nr:hypothetical protein GP486_006214 [Trichoglossum hirsutum]
MSEPFKDTAAEKAYGRAFDKADLGDPAVAQRIKCKTCREMRKKELFSENQLNELRHKIYQCGKQITMFNAQIKCKLCSGLQPNQMLCFGCGEIKTFNDFAKAQRHSPDNAFIAETEPGLEVLSQDEDSDLSGTEYDIQAVDHALQGLDIQTTEPHESPSSSISVGNSDKFTPGDGDDTLGSKRALRSSSITSKSSMGRSISMATVDSKEGRANKVGSSLTDRGGAPGGGVALSGSTDMDHCKIIGERGGRSFFTAYDSGGHAYLRQAEYASDEERSVSELTEVSRGGWGRIDVTEQRDDDFASAWTGGRGSSGVKAGEPAQQMLEVAKTSYFKGKMIGASGGSDGDSENDLPEL